jgi:hypothetical protein
MQHDAGQANNQHTGQGIGQRTRQGIHGDSAAGKHAGAGGDPGRRIMLGTGLFAAGALIGTLFLGLVVWANFEAAMFNPAIRGETVLRIQRYPPMLTRGETGTVRVAFHNPGPNATSPTVRATTSFRSAAVIAAQDRTFRIEPGQTVVQTWEVRAEDLAWNRFVFFRLYQHASYPLRSASGYRGIVVLDIPWISGRMLSVLAVVASLALMAAGILLRLAGGVSGRSADRPVGRLGAMSVDRLGAMSVDRLGALPGGRLSACPLCRLVALSVGRLGALPVGRGATLPAGRGAVMPVDRGAGHPGIRTMLFLAALVSGGILAGFFGQWVIGAGALVGMVIISAMIVLVAVSGE